MSPRDRVSAAVRRLREDPKASPTLRFLGWCWRVVKELWRAAMVVVKAWTVRTAALGLLTLIVEDVENTHALQKLAIENHQTLTPASALTAIHWSFAVLAIAALFGEEEFRELLKRITFAIGLKAGYERSDVNIQQRTEILERRQIDAAGNATEPA